MKYKIYTLKHPVTNEIRYVGFTSKELYERLAVHVYQAKHRKRKTYAARWVFSLLKQGLKPKIELLDETNDNWQDLEIYWIAQFKAWGFRLCNYSIGGDKNNLGKKASKETILKKSKPISQYTFDGEFIRDYISTTEASKILGVTKSTIGVAVRTGGTCLGYKWSFKDIPLKFIAKETLRCPIYQYDIDGNFIKEWESPKKAQKILNIQAANISKVLKGKRTNAGGFQWRYSTIKQEVSDIVISLTGVKREIIVEEDGKDIEFASSREVAKYLGVCYQLVSVILQGKIKNSKKLNGRKLRYKK